MFAADELPSVDHRRRSRRHRSSRGGFAHRLKRGLRRARVGRAIFMLVLVAGVVVGGYKASMYVLDHGLPSTEEFRTSK